MLQPVSPFPTFFKWLTLRRIQIQVCLKKVEGVAVPKKRTVAYTTEMKPCKFTEACQLINNIYLTLNMRAKNTWTCIIQNNCRLLTKFAFRRV